MNRSKLRKRNGESLPGKGNSLFRACRQERVELSEKEIRPMLRRSNAEWREGGRAEL